MSNWKVTFWNGYTLKEITIYSDWYNLLNAINCSEAAPSINALISIERVPS